MSEQIWKRIVCDCDATSICPQGRTGAAMRCIINLKDDRAELIARLKKAEVALALMRAKYGNDEVGQR